MATIIDIEQGSSAWIAYRWEGIGGSDAPIIMGASPWKTAQELLKEKIKPPRDSKSNPAQQRGHDLEPVARAYYELRSSLEFPATCMEDSEFSFLRGSYDGHNASEKIDLEIKCPGREDHLSALKGEVPKKYVWQCQHLLMVSGSERLDYFSFDGKRGCVIHIKPDLNLIKQLRERELEFWNLVTSARKTSLRA